MFLIPSLSFPQSQLKEWSDGDPVFTKTIAGLGVRVKDIATLAPQSGTSGGDELLNFKLFGLDWQWPQSIIIISAEDIDSRQVSGETLYLVTDALGRRIVEINSRFEEVWSFGSQIVGDPKYLNKPVDAFIFSENNYNKILITDQDRNRVIKIHKETQNVEWQYGDPNGREGSEFNQLRSPADAEKIANANEYIIADKGNDRIIIVDEVTNNILWKIENDVLKAPTDVEYDTLQAQVLVTDQDNHRVIIVDRTSNNIVWQYGELGVADSSAGHLNKPADADFLDNGNILIADTGNDRTLEVDRDGNIVWQFHRKLASLRDVDRMPDKKTLVVSNNFPSSLAYADSLIVSQYFDFGENRESVFDRIFWEADTTFGITSVQLQIRSANSLGDLERANWYGPQGKNTFYRTSDAAVNPVHNGHRLYQIRALLTTNDPLFTPTLTSVKIDHHYFNIDAQGYFYTSTITESEGRIISKWKQLIFRTKLPEDPVKRDKISLEVQIHNTKTFELIDRFSADKSNAQNIFNLETIPSLNRVQSIYMIAYLSTTDPSVSPVMDNWKVTWESVPSANSGIQFTNSRAFPVIYYRATETLPAQEAKVDSLFIFLLDPDLEPFQDLYRVSVKAKKSSDSVDVDLKLQPLGGFFSQKAIPILVTDKIDRENQILEVWDRDSLYVIYMDQYNPLDVSSDTIRVIKNTTGTLFIEDARGKVLSKVTFGDTLYVRIKGENDRNIDPNNQETISVEVYDRSTFDEEKLTLYEVAGGLGVYDTGEFESNFGLIVYENNNGTMGNNQIETLKGHRITANYVDNVQLDAFVTVPSEGDTTPSPINIYFGREPYIVEIAPNPYYQGSHSKFRLRVASSTGSLLVRYIEIFNLAGERVREVTGNQLQFNTGLGISIPKEKYGIVENWWDLKNENRQYVSSGTYWAKVHADLISDETGTVEQVAFFRKFVLIR